MPCCRFVIACVAALSCTVVPARAQVASSVAPEESVAPPSSAPLLNAPSQPRSPFTSLFRDLVTDFSRIPSQDHMIIAAVGGVAAGVAHPFDARISRSWSGSSRLHGVFGAGDTLGSAALQMAGAVTTQVIGRVSGNERMRVIGADLVRAQIVTQSLTAGIKLSVQRTRPDGSQFSLPSGHASTTFATATVLQRHLGWKAGLPAYGLATYVAASRIQMKRHYLSDVTLGAALGIIAGRSVTVGRGEARFAVTPAAYPGGAGLNLTWVGQK